MPPSCGEGALGSAQYSVSPQLSTKTRQGLHAVALHKLQREGFVHKNNDFTYAPIQYGWLG